MAGPYELQSPKDIAMEYGGNKQKIAQAAQMGLVDPTAAVLAGMFIDKMRTAQQEEIATDQTVAQETFPTQMAMAPAGLGATPQGQQMAPQMQQAQAPVMAAQGGLMALDVPDDMVPDEYAGGGIIAFANGGGVSLSDVLRTLTMDEARMYQQTGRLPARAQAILAGQTALPTTSVGSLNPTVIDDYPGIDFTDADIAKATASIPNIPAKSRPAAQANLVEIAPEAASLSIAERLAQREKEQKEFLGENPKIAKMQELLDKQDEDSFLDRALRSLQMVTAGEALRTKGDTSGLKEVMATESERSKAKATRAEKRAELEGADYERRASIYGDVTKEAFQERVMERKIKAEKELARMRPASASEYIGNLLRSKNPEDRAVGRMLAGQGKTGEITRAKAFEMYNDPTAFDLRKKYPTFELFYAYATGAGGSGAGGEVDTNNPLLK